ncbi:MAG: N-acetylmuramoyl-L-alanine amidase [Candidatus Omnitrophica bacterium]|nr:N-acetylmuramoyl-L-alanine amidase [Candidatus Omnitrophota bacterium]
MLNRKIYLFLFYLILFINGCATVPRQPVIAPGQGIYHTVGSGQTIYRIAKTYNVDIQELMRINRINDPTHIEVGQKLFIPGAKVPLPVEVYRPIPQELVEKLVGPKHLSSQRCYITIHHSATLEGNAECFDRYHRHRKMGGLFYHFVIGNGRGSGDGEIEVGWRWKRQEEVNRPYDIQICLVGNFNKELVSNAQFDALVKLIRVLCRQYNIPLENIRRHQDVADKFTECPGSNFPFYQLLTELKQN